jgi:hypothetical protein
MYDIEGGCKILGVKRSVDEFKVICRRVVGYSDEVVVSLYVGICI